MLLEESTDVSKTGGRAVSIWMSGATLLALDSDFPGLELLVVEALGLTNLDWSDFISRTVKPKFVDVNLKAFQKGREAVAGGER